MTIAECIKQLESLRSRCDEMFDEKFASGETFNEGVEALYISSMALDMALKILRSPNAYQARPLTEGELKELYEAIKNQPLITIEPLSPWISVEKALPADNSTQVLMTDGERCYISARNNMVRFADCDGIFIPGKSGAGVRITHWMPLPDLPEQE